jgi:hypothetical protein
MANVYALKALSMVPKLEDNPAVLRAVRVLLDHWRDGTRKYLFGVGTDYRRLKYPYVWYNILHVAEVLSRFPSARLDLRLGEMVDSITAQSDEDGRYTAGSMYRAWRGWSFANKKQPSPWLTLLVLRIQDRMAAGGASQNQRGASPGLMEPTGEPGCTESTRTHRRGQAC